MLTGCMRVVLFLVAALCLAPTTLSAEHVDEGVQSAYDEAKKLHAKGDPQSLAQAFYTLDPRKDEALGSIDYWTLYARVWLALKKDPKSIAARTAKAEWLIAGDEEDEGAELIEEILEEDPHALGALLAIARLDLSDGLAEDALEYVDTALEEHETAEVHLLIQVQSAQVQVDRGLPPGLRVPRGAEGLWASRESIRCWLRGLRRRGPPRGDVEVLRGSRRRTELESHRGATCRDAGLGTRRRKARRGAERQGGCPALDG